LAEYRRFISYIYAYEGDMKTKNVGFAKIEARNGQCRISISIKGAYECSGQELTLFGYGYQEADCLLVPLGQIPVKNGTGEAVFGKQEENLSGSGYGLGFVKGLYLRSRGSVGKAYLTTWDDTVIHITTLRNARIAGEKRGLKAENDLKAAALPEAEAKVAEALTGMEAFRQSEQTTKAEPLDLKLAGPKVLQAVLPQLLEPKEQELSEPKGPKLAESRISQLPEPKMAAPSEPVVPETPKTLKLKKPEQPELLGPEPSNLEEQAEPTERKTEGKMPENFYFREGFPELPLWECLQKILPRKRILSEEGWEVLQIHIQDIGRLPRENWPYGNNSFVLHGYFQYQYLILARRPRASAKRFQSGYQYILGVPGIFKPQEKFMASMFGLPEFKRAAGNRTEDFGFWCGTVQM
jgi:hypothetical protein